MTVVVYFLILLSTDLRTFLNGNHSTIGGEMCLFFRIMGGCFFKIKGQSRGKFIFHKQTNDNLKKDHTNKSTKKSEKVIHHRYDLRGEEEGKQSRIFFSKYIVIIFKLMSFFLSH